ncbi:MAG TPA: acyltransferase domain-containing protein [Amycolatopsis sp.]|uniref:acyltransferase domain-containing protein n=1 Tax=Amycolatopsis sp. TaxID=37632 RepID=UPI002B46430F|nr:acyltransferase domain-containing protein [Amycolatopsis sp.]HKS44425.1 acyltransferase domain-containing protein [Amycolatopsis sp.]
MTGRGLVLLLPGQGSQYQGMAVELYEREPVFATVADEFFAAMGPEGKLVRNDWLSDTPGVPIDDGTRAQPLLFIIGYAIGTVLHSRGLQPVRLIGHSVGELAAAALAGVFDLPAAGRILAARSRVLAGAPAGGMLAVAAAPATVEAVVDPVWAAKGLVVGAVNAPAQTILTGPEPELSLVEEALWTAGLTSRRVRSAQPFHSPVLNAAADVFEQAVAAERLRPPRIPITSAWTGRPVESADGLRPAFWARQMAEPVRFWEAVSSLPDDGEFTMVEAGPGNLLSVIARRHPSVRARRSEVFGLLPTEGKAAWPVWLAGLEKLAEQSISPRGSQNCSAR